MKLFEEFDEDYVNKNLQKLEYSPENVKKLVDYQKENGGVLRIPNNDDAILEFERLGFEVKHLAFAELPDEQIMDDMTNFNKVNYVIVYSENDEQDTDDVIQGEKPDDIKNFDEFDEIEQ